MKNLNYKVRKQNRINMRVVMTFLKLSVEKYGPRYDGSNFVTRRELTREICYSVDGKKCRKLDSIPLMERDNYLRDAYLNTRLGELVRKQLLYRVKAGCFGLRRNAYLIIYAKTGGHPDRVDAAWLSEWLSSEYQL